SDALLPFDHSKADIILRSSDNVDFRVFELFLSLASSGSFFETMFELPQPASQNDTKAGLPLISVSEDNQTLDTSLRFCYPSTLADDPCLDEVDAAVSVLNAARKYQVDRIERKVGQSLYNPKILATDSLRRFAIARHSRLEDETMLAAKYTLHEPLIPPHFSGVELITASDLLSLLQYHQKCSIATEVLGKYLFWINTIGPRRARHG
ncbi:hypothetical protein BV22DRAFT_1173104, partial [Leucogyrophana mollusca]